MIEMFNMMWELKYQEALAEGRTEEWARGWAEGWVKGYTERAISDLKNLMETLGLSLEQAMSALKVPEAEQQLYIELLKQ